MDLGRGILGVAALALAGCEERVRECDGGVEVVLSVDPAELDRAGAELVVTAVVAGEAATRRFDISYLTSGSTSLILDLDLPDAAELQVLVEVGYDGPGNGAAATWLAGEGLVQVPGGDRGCQLLAIELVRAPDRDGDRVPDPADVCPDEPDGDQDDGDGDAIGDACDLCPAISDDNHDEDGDGIADACDPCPHLPDEGEPADADEDGVGDACDPRPGEPGDEIVLFLGFGDADDLLALTQIGAGTVTVANDAVELATTTELALLASLALGPELEMATESHRIAGGTGSPWGEGTLAWNPMPSPSVDGIVCMAERDDIRVIGWPFVSLPGGGSAVDDTNQIHFISVLEGKVGQADVALTCTINGESANATLTAPGNGLHPGFGLFVADSTVRFDYLFIVDRP